MTDALSLLHALETAAPYGALRVEPGVESVGLPLPLGRLTGSRVAAHSATGALFLLIPGYTGSKEDFRLVLPALAAHDRAGLALSRRGQADSDGPSDADGYTLDAEAADVIHAAESLGAPVHLVGHSLGGVIARSAVINAPDVFASVTLLCSGPRGWAYRKLRERVVAAEAGNAALWDATNPRWIGVDPAEMDADTRFVRDRLLDTRAGSIVGGARILESDDDTTERLRSTGVPVHVVRGASDEHWPSVWQEEMATRLGAPYTVIPDADHSPALENPRATASALAGFWARHD